MNTKPTAKRILCFGDSNTRGTKPFDPQKGVWGRWEADIRWTGILQNLLGENFEVIEEGLDARLTAFDDPREGFVGKNGKSYLLPCLDSHNPLDLVILMLGTPDLKEIMNLTAVEIADGIEKLVKIVSQTKSVTTQKPPKILLLSPHIINESTQFASTMFKGGTEKNKKFSELYQKIAEKHNVQFLDISKVVDPNKDEGIHLDAKSHKKLGEEVFKKVQEIFS